MEKNRYYNPAADYLQFAKAQAKLKRAEAGVAAAHERMKTKFNNIVKDNEASILRP